MEGMKLDCFEDCVPVENESHPDFGGRVLPEGNSSQRLDRESLPWAN